MPLRESPGLVLCAIFTLRFEAPYILPWVAHHRRLGVDRLLLYHDDASSMWSPSLSDRHSELLSALREHDNWITLYSAASLNFSGEIQTQQIAHCNVEALRLNASWAANWDLDEWLLVESRDRSWRRALGDRMAGLPAELRALQINRVEFGAPQTLELPPLHLLEPEVQTIEIYAHKRGKTMWRPDPSLEHSTRGGHRLYRQHWAERALPWSSCTGSTGVMHLSANASCTIALELLPRLRIQHFSHRSRSECLRKVELFQLFYVAAKQNAMVRYNVSAQDGCDWRRTYPDHKYANKSLNASLEDVRAFISHTFAQGLGVLDREQRQFREGLDAYMHGGSPDVTLAEIAGRTHTSPSSMPMRRGVIAPGLGTTGTHSVHHVLCTLGFNSMHTNQNCTARIRTAQLMDDVGVRRLKPIDGTGDLWMLNSTDPSSVVASMRAAVDLTLKNINDWGVNAVADHPVFYIHDELAAAFPHATVLLSTRNATEWAIRRAEQHSHQMVCSEAPTRGWPITEGDGPPLPHPFAIVACVERFARLSAARRSERPVFTHTGTARRDFLADGLEAFNAHVRASARARGAPFAEVDIFAEPAANLFARVEALLPQAAALHAPAWTQLRSSNYFGAPPRPRKRPRPPPPPCLHGSFADGGARSRREDAHPSPEWLSSALKTKLQRLRSSADALPCNASGSVTDVEVADVEFGYDIFQSVPAVYARCLAGTLGRLSVCAGMRPLYYFVHRDSVSERPCSHSFDRTWLPRQHVQPPASQRWPPYADVFATSVQLVYVYNKFNREWRHEPINTWSAKTIAEVTKLAACNGLSVIYSQPPNRDDLGTGENGEVDTTGAGSGAAGGAGREACAEAASAAGAVVLGDDVFDDVERLNVLQLVLMSSASFTVGVQGGMAVLNGLVGGRALVLCKQGRECGSGDFSWYGALHRDGERGSKLEMLQLDHDGEGLAARAKLVASGFARECSSMSLLDHQRSAK